MNNNSYYNLAVVILLLFLLGCKEETNNKNQFTLINKGDYYVDYATHDIYRFTETKKPMNGYFVVGKDLKKWEEFKVENGVLNGEYLFYHDNGNISIKSNYAHGKMVGYEEYFYPSGEIMKRYKIVDENKHGQGLKYYENGQIESEFSYEDGKLMEYTNYDLIGHITSQKFIQDGRSITQILKGGNVASEEISSNYDDFEAMKFYNANGELEMYLRMIDNDNEHYLIELNKDGEEIKRINLETNPEAIYNYQKYFSKMQ